jgi:hypothetical protein
MIAGFCAPLLLGALRYGVALLTVPLTRGVD